MKTSVSLFYVKFKNLTETFGLSCSSVQILPSYKYSFWNETSLPQTFWVNLNALQILPFFYVIKVFNNKNNVSWFSLQ